MRECLAALNLVAGICLNERGDVLRIVELFDEFGEHTDHTGEARSFVAGPDGRGRYWGGAVADFEKMVVH